MGLADRLERERYGPELGADNVKVTSVRPRVTEAQWQATVLELAKTLGWSLTYHTWDSRHSAAGFPDLVLIHVRRARVLVRELKTDKGRVSAAQQAWLDGWTAVGVDAGVWRPADWDRVVKELSA